MPILKDVFGDVNQGQVKMNGVKQNTRKTMKKQYIKRIENDPVMRKQYQGYDNYMKRCNAIFKKHGVLVEMRAKNDECYGRIYTIYAKTGPYDYRYKSITSGILPGQCIEQFINYGLYAQVGAANRVADALRELGYTL